MRKYQLEDKRKCRISDIITINIYEDNVLKVMTSGLNDNELFKVIEDLYLQLQEDSSFYNGKQISMVFCND